MRAWVFKYPVCGFSRTSVASSPALVLHTYRVRETSCAFLVSCFSFLRSPFSVLVSCIVERRSLCLPDAIKRYRHHLHHIHHLHHHHHIHHLTCPSRSTNRRGTADRHQAFRRPLRAESFRFSLSLRPTAIVIESSRVGSNTRYNEFQSRWHVGTAKGRHVDPSQTGKVRPLRALGGGLRPWGDGEEYLVL